MVDFNAWYLDSTMKDFFKVIGLINLIKGNICFKGKGSDIDLLLTKRRYIFTSVLSKYTPKNMFQLVEKSKYFSSL